MATTKENVRAKVCTLLDDIRPHLEQKLEKLLDSGVIDFEKENDTWGLPKDIIIAMAKEVEFQYSDPHPQRGYKKRLDKIFRAIRLEYSYENI
jgi:hypothetical protein